MIMYSKRNVVKIENTKPKNGALLRKLSEMHVLSTLGSTMKVYKCIRVRNDARTKMEGLVEARFLPLICR